MESIVCLSNKLSKSQKKINRKQARCRNILMKHEGLETVEYPTNCLLVGNGGLVCGVDRECLMGIFSRYGSVKDIVMKADKPYSFVVYADTESSMQAMKCVNGQNIKLVSENPLYLCYIKEVPSKIHCSYVLPPGLIVIEDFVTDAEERKLMDLINLDEMNDNGNMKNRKVKHFGYEFNYATNNVDRNKPLVEKIPDLCSRHLQHLFSLGHISRIPNQLTVNHYLPGQGIPPHIDTHSAFEDGIISLSLGSQVIMDFVHPEKEQISVVLKQRSVLIMTKDSRYVWKHGITPRKTDVLPVFEGNSFLTLSYRSARTSFTFRTVRETPCDCDFPSCCDSQMDISDKICKKNEAQTLEFGPTDIEKLYVNEVYENIAGHFSETRFKPWPEVAKFIESIPLGSLMVDAGCGNGKNMNQNTNYYQIGCDVSVNLASLCAERNLQVVVADVLKLPFRDNSIDVCICIAVIHHMASTGHRLQAIAEILRILKCGGKSLVYVWAMEQGLQDGRSNYLCEKKTTEKTQDNQSGKHVKIVEDESNVELSVHKNRTQFKQQDVLVPWHNKAEANENKIFHRYYHVFTEGELEKLVLGNNAKILESYYDNGNWGVIFEKTTV